MARIKSKQVNLFDKPYTGSFGVSGSTELIGPVRITGSMTSGNSIAAQTFTGIFNGALSSSAQIASDISGSFGNDSASFSTRVTNLKIDSGSFSTRITNFSTGNVELVSGSSTSTGSFGELEVDTNATIDGDLFVSQYIKHTGDADTFINFTDNRIRLKAGDIGFFDMEKDSDAPYPATINPGGNRVNFRVVDRNTDLLLKTDSEALNVGLYHAGNKKLETKSTGVDIFGDIEATGNIIAKTFIVSSSVTNMTQSFSSGSTIFGDTPADDTHQFTGSLSVTSSILTIDNVGSISGSATSTGSFGTLRGDGSQLTGITTDVFSDGSANRISGSSVSTGSFSILQLDGATFTSASLAAGGSGGGGGGGTFNGNRVVSNTQIGALYTNEYNAGTTGSVADFLEKIFFPNEPPQISSSQFTIQEFVTSGSVVGAITASDAEIAIQTLTYSTQSIYTDDFFKIHSGSAEITLNANSSASMNTTASQHAGGDSHPFFVEVSDGIATSKATIFIRVVPNTAPNFRTTSTSGAIVTAQTGSVNENTTNGTQILEFFVSDEESDTITISPLSQSAENRFALSTADVGGGKRLRITTATASFDFETITEHRLFVSASDQHHGNTSGSYVRTLPILVNVTDNLAPTMGSQVFSINEENASHTNHGLGTSANNVVTVGSVSTNDAEGDTVTFTGLTLTSGSGGGNNSQTDVSNNPFQITTGGVLQLKAAQYLNSDIFNQYKYDATYKDNFNDASSSGVLTINIADDAIPTLTSNSANFYIIESAASSSLVRTNSNGRTGTQADFNSNETVAFTVNPSDKFSVNSNGQISMNFNVSGSEFTFDNSSTIAGSVTASNAFGTFTQSAFTVGVAINNSPDISFNKTSANLNSNGARPGNNIGTITFNDVEGDALNHNTFQFTDPSGQLSAVKSGDTYNLAPQSNLSGSTAYQFTASIEDEHGFRTETTQSIYDIVQAPIGTLGTNGTFFIIESAVRGDIVRTSSDGRTGGSALLNVNYSPNFNSATVQNFTSSNDMISINDAGRIDVGVTDVSGSAFNFDNGNPITADVTFRDQYDNIGSGSISINVAINNAPQPSFSDNSVNLNTNLGRSGSLISTVSFTDAESDALNHNTFQFTDPSGQLNAIKSGNNYLIQAKNKLSGSTIYGMTASIQDTHGFRTGTQTNTVNIVQAPIGAMSTNGTQYVIESAVTGDIISVNSLGRAPGAQGDLNVSYSPNFGSATVQNFTSSNAMVAIANNGNLTVGATNVSESAFTFDAGNPITADVTYRDQYDNIGSGSLSINVAINNAPTITLSNNSRTFTAEQALSGSFITSASFSDIENDNIAFDSFTIGGTNGNVFTAHRSGNAMVIHTNTDLSGSLSNYSYNVTVRDIHRFRDSAAVGGTVSVTPMIYFYKQTTRVSVMNASNAIELLGDTGGDDVAVSSGSNLGHFKAGDIGDKTISTSALGGGTTTLIASQSLNNLANTGGTSTWRQFGNINLTGNGGNGHSWLVLYPSSSAINQKPQTIGNEMNAPHPDGEFVVFNDNSALDAVEGAGLHYFSTNAGVKALGSDRWGMIFGQSGNTAGSQFYHLIPSSGSAPSSEL